MLRDLVQEVRELGLRGTAFRASWELRKRSGAFERLTAEPEQTGWVASGRWASRLPFPDPATVVRALDGRIPATNLEQLTARARAAAKGRIRCFGRWVADFGDPIDWHRNPTNGQRWNPEALWSHVLADEARVGDVKLTWEIARFPHAFELARAAAFDPDSADAFGEALLAQLEGFNRANPYGRGVHWGSGQETAIRLFAWLFALDVLLARGPHRERASRLVGEALQVGATHIAHHLEYAREAVFNNHLLSEALGLYAAGALVGGEAFRRLGREILVAECTRQFYRDGGYIQQSHNYHRVALHNLLCAVLIAKAGGESVDDAWLGAMDRSLTFLLAHQNPADGRLPNYGGNDGALPLVLDTCDYSDFRPVLQTVSCLVRGKRLYEAGPWDECTAWVLGPQALDLPLEAPRRHSVSFPETGHHVVRGRDEGSFAAFRCGTLRDRFSQIDMLHLDVWWRGLNVFVDPGSYLYNGAEVWHDHFVETASHNTVVVDGHDQMLHFRRFKVLYWTKARLLSFHDDADHALCAGEHLGFVRHPGACVHRRSVAFMKDDLWIVVDQVRGEGAHQARLQWLAGQADATYAVSDGRLSLATQQGAFSAAVYDGLARPLVGDVVAGAEHPPRVWLSRYYAVKQPVASLSVAQTGVAPLTFITVMGEGAPMLALEGALYVVTHGPRVVRFRVSDGIISLAETKDEVRR